MAKICYIGEHDSTEAFETTFVKNVQWDESELLPKVFAILSKNPQFACTGNSETPAEPASTA